MRIDWKNRRGVVNCVREGGKGMEYRCVKCGFRIKTLFVQYSPGNIRLMKCVIYHFLLSIFPSNFQFFQFTINFATTPPSPFTGELQSSGRRVHRMWNHGKNKIKFMLFIFNFVYRLTCPVFFFYIIFCRFFWSIWFCTSLKLIGICSIMCLIVKLWISRY